MAIKICGEIGNDYWDKGDGQSKLNKVLNAKYFNKYGASELKSRLLAIRPRLKGFELYIGADEESLWINHTMNDDAEVNDIVIEYFNEIGYNRMCAVCEEEAKEMVDRLAMDIPIIHDYIKFI